MEEKELLLALRKGDVKSMEVLFNQYYAPLIRYGESILRDSDETEDIVQHIFVSLWEKRETQEIHSSVRAFLYKSVYNAALNRLKHQKVKANFQSNELYFQDVEENDVSELMEVNELEYRISQAISKIPKACATVFKLSREENLKYKEIAEHLNISIKTVENQMGKALSILRSELKMYLPLFFMLLFDVLANGFRNFFD